MLYKCANEACSAPFRKLREGKLFQVETEYFAGDISMTGRRGRPGRKVEHYWLCDSCSPYVNAVEVCRSANDKCRFKRLRCLTTHHATPSACDCRQRLG